MTLAVVDASALAAVVFNEPAGAAVSRALEGATVFAPTLLSFELANTALKKARRNPAAAPALLAALGIVLDPRWGLTWQEVDAADSVQIAVATGLSAYDASYLWLAGSLGADLITLDERLAKAGATLVL
jgi:predicted nucleic acid-binding protein